MKSEIVGNRQIIIIHNHMHTHNEFINIFCPCVIIKIKFGVRVLALLNLSIYFDFAATGVEKYNFSCLLTYVLTYLLPFCTCTCRFDCTACEQNLIIIYFWPNGDNNNEDDIVGAITQYHHCCSNTLTTFTRNMARK